MDLDNDEQVFTDTSTESQLDPQNFHRWDDIRNLDGLTNPAYQPCREAQREAEKKIEQKMGQYVPLTGRERQLEKAVQAVMMADVEASQCRLRLLSANKKLLGLRTTSASEEREASLEFAQQEVVHREEAAQKANANLSQAQQRLLVCSQDLLTEKTKAAAGHSQSGVCGRKSMNDETGTQDSNNETQELFHTENTEPNAPTPTIFLFFLSDRTLGAILSHLNDCNTAAKFYEQAAAAWKILGDEAQQTKQAAAVQVKTDAIPWPVILAWGDVRAYETMVDALTSYVHGRNAPLYVKVKCIEHWLEEGVVILDQGPARYAGGETSGSEMEESVVVSDQGPAHYGGGETSGSDGGSEMRVTESP